MKTTLAPLALSLLLLAGCSKQLADTVPAEASLRSTTNSMVATNIVVKDEVPYYPNEDVFLSTYDQLADEVDKHQEALYDQYKADTFPDSKYAASARKAWEENDAPLQQYEERLGLKSMRRQVKDRVRAWLDRQQASNTLDTASYPDRTGTDATFKALINYEGNYGVGDTLYHIESDEFIVKIPGIKNTAVFDTIRTLQAQGRDKLVSWLYGTDPQRGIVFWPDPIRWPFGKCKTNVSAFNWQQVDGRTLVLTSQSWHYSFFFTKGVFKVNTYRRLGFGWVPSLEIMKAGIDVYFYDWTCGRQQHKIVPETFAWGIGTERKVKLIFRWHIAQPIRAGNTIVDGFWGTYRIRNFGIQRYAPLNF